MPGRWKEWEQAKREMKTDGPARRAAVDQALDIIQTAQRGRTAKPGQMQCPSCGGIKFKTVVKGAQWTCRLCGSLVTRPEEA